MYSSEYSFVVEADYETGGYVIWFPDLPGCMTQVESINEVGPAAKEIRDLWVETTQGHDIPLPIGQSEYYRLVAVRMYKDLYDYLRKAAKNTGDTTEDFIVDVLEAAKCMDMKYPRQHHTSVLSTN